LDEGEVDPDKARELAERHLDPKLAANARGLYADLDDLHVAIAALVAPITARLEPIRDALLILLDEVGREEAYRWMHGLDDSVSYATAKRAQALFDAWSGLAGLTARLWRLDDDIESLSGEMTVDPERIARILDEERGA